MAKITDEAKPISAPTRELTDRATELVRCKDQNSVLKKELAECRTEVDSDGALLASGLRLAFKNEALEVEKRLLRQDAATRSA